MNNPLNDDYQRMASEAICHAARTAGIEWQQAAYEHMRPCVIFRPRIFIDEGKWCALYGEDLQHGIYGFGDSPEIAMYDFDKNYCKKLPNQEIVA